MKKLVIILILGIILLGSILFVSAMEDSLGNIVGACTGRQTCFCSGQRVDCPCDADPCVICGPTSPECIERTGQSSNKQTQTGSSGIIGTGGNTGAIASDSSNPQTPSGYLELIGDGLRNLVLTALGKPSIVGGKLETSRPTTTEIILSIIALVALLTTSVAVVSTIFKSILAKILMAGKVAPRVMS